MVAQRGAFGKVSRSIEPAEGVDPADPRYRAAILQHFLARWIRDALGIRGVTPAEFLASVPDAPGLSVDRQRRVLRGETTATYTDLAFWAGHFPFIARQMSAYLASWADADSPQKPDVAPQATARAQARPPLR